jgi:hypothetical protein
MQLDVDVIKHAPSVRGKFGFKEEQFFLVTFGMNEKGGMDEKEFEEYILNSIVPLYSCAKNKRRKGVILKADSGPRQENMGLLSTLKLLRFVLYPCVPMH